MTTMERLPVEISPIVTPENLWYIKLNDDYHINLNLDGDISLYNSIFNTNYYNWDEVYDNFENMDISKNDVLSYYASKSGDYFEYALEITKGDPKSLLDIGVLKYTNSYVILSEYLPKLGYSDIEELLRVNLLKLNADYLILSELYNLIVPERTVDYVLDFAIKCFNGKLYNTVYKYAILLFDKHTRYVLPRPITDILLPYLGYHGFNGVLFVLIRWYQYGIRSLRILESYTTFSDVIGRIALHMFSTFTDSQIVNTINTYGILIDPVRSAESDNTRVLRLLPNQLPSLEDLWNIHTYDLYEINRHYSVDTYDQLTVRPPYSEYEYMSIAEYNIYNNTSFRDVNDLNQYIESNDIDRKIQHIIDNRSPDLLLTIPFRHNRRVQPSVAVDVFKSKYDITVRFVSAMVELFSSKFPYEEVIDVITELYDPDIDIPVLGGDVILELLRGIRRNLVDPKYLLKLVVPITRLLDYDCLVELVRAISHYAYSRRAVTYEFKKEFVLSTYITTMKYHKDRLEEVLEIILDESEYWLSSYMMSSILYELNKEGIIDVTQQLIDNIENYQPDR